MTYETCHEDERKKIRENLLKYCEMDTLAEFMIISKLKELVNYENGW